MKDEESKYSNLQRIVPDYHALNQTKKDIEDIVSRIADTETEVRRLTEEKEGKENGWLSDQGSYDLLKVLVEDMQQIDALNKEIERMEGERKTLQEQLPDSGSRSSAAVKQELKTVSDKLKQNRKSCDKMQHNYNELNKTLTLLERTCNELTNDKLKIEGKQQQAAEMMRSKNDLKRKVSSIKDEIETIKKDLEPLQDSLEAKEKEKMEFQRACKEEQNELKEKEKSLREYNYKVGIIDGHIKKFEEEGKEIEFEEAVIQKEKMKEELEKLRKEKETHENESNRIKNELANQTSTLRNLRDNMQLIDLKLKERSQQEEIEKYSAQLSSTDFDVIDRKKKSLIQKINELSTDISSGIGKTSVMERSIKDIEAELNNPKLKDAAR